MKYIQIFATLFPVLFLFGGIALPKYKAYCKKCAQTCSLFTDGNLKTCISNCYCPNIKPVMTKHVDNYTMFDLDKDICLNGYADPPVLSRSSTPINRDVRNRGKSKPNIILFVLDDLDEMISPYFEAMPFAQKLFQQNGTHFTNGFTSTSYCCPARCQILSGMYAHNNGVIGMYGKYATVNGFRTPYEQNGERMMEGDKCINNENRTINTLLQKYGKYHTTILGKYLNGIENEETRHIDYMPTGWNEFHIGSDPYMYPGYRYTLTNYSSNDPNGTIGYEWYSVEPEDYITDVLTRKTVNIIEKQKSILKNPNPMFMYIAPSAPHLPLPPAERHRNKIEYWRSQYDKYVVNRSNYGLVHNTKPEWYKNHERKIQINSEGETWNKLEWEKRMTSLYAVDEMFEQIYNKIKEVGELDNTVFALVSDNGYNLGAHGIFNKMAPYDESVRVPFYLSGPNFKKNFNDDELVLLNDLAPTFLHLADLEPPANINGKSLMQLSSSSKSFFGINPKRSAVLLEFKNVVNYVVEDNIDINPEIAFIRDIVPKWMLFDFHPYVGIRTYDHLYVEYNVNNQTTEYELYDLKTDPYQIVNVYNVTSYDNIKKVLKYKLDNLAKCKGKQCIG